MIVKLCQIYIYTVHCIQYTVYSTVTKQPFVTLKAQVGPQSTIEWPCTVNSRLASWTIPDLFLSREKYRCRAEIDHFANQLLNLQGFISVVYVWGVSHCLKCNIYSQFSLLSMNLLVCSSPRYNMGKYYFLGFRSRAGHSLI